MRTSTFLFVQKQGSISSRQHCLSHQKPIDTFGGAAAIGNRPHYQRLSACHVAGGKDCRQVRCFFLIDRDVAARVDCHTELGEQPVSFGTEKAKREQHQLRGPFLLSSQNLSWRSAASVSSSPLHLNCANGANLSVVANESFAHHRVGARIFSQ